MGQTRLAVVEDGALCELYIERRNTENLAGNVYLSRVENVLPGMNAAFVDIGLDKNGFLYAGDLAPGLQADEGGSRATPSPAIDRLVRPGQQIMVQVAKAQTGAKGPRLCGQVTLTGRLAALMPGTRCAGVSRKIAREDERARLHAIGQALLAERGEGLILRTASEGVPEADIRSEYDALVAQWRRIQDLSRHAAAPRLLHANADLALQAVRDRLCEDTDALWTDDPALYARLRQLAAACAPAWADRVLLHEGDVPLFDLYRVDAQADRALQKYVWLKSGGSLVIEATEALTVIDVNTGKYTGRRDLDETLFSANCEAAREIMRQLRLRDIGGIVVVDFIDMRREAHRQALLELLREEAGRDRNRVNVVGITPLGLVELTRKKLRQPLAKQLLHTCGHCAGNGAVPAHETTARRVERELWRRRRAGETNPILVEAAEEVCGWLRTLGAPEGGAVYALPSPDLPEGEYRLSPADERALPPNTTLLKRGKKP